MPVEVRHPYEERWRAGKIDAVSHMKADDGSLVPIVTALHPGGVLMVPWPHRDIRVPS